MASLTTLARKVAEKGARGTLEAGSRRITAGASDGIAAILRRLPLPMLISVKTSLGSVTQLDYESERILLNVESEIDLARANSCSKEPETIRWIEDHVKAGDVFYDVGANVGAYAMVAARQAPGRVVVHAFEPSFATYHQLCNNVILNGYQKDVFPHLLALGSENGVSVLNYRSLVAGTSLHTVGVNVNFRGKEFEPEYRQRILVFRLDDLVQSWGFDMPNHIKIDVDGTELDVLLGARRILRDPRLKSVLVEVCHDRGHAGEIRQLMESSDLGLDSEVFLQPTVSNQVWVREAS